MKYAGKLMKGFASLRAKEHSYLQATTMKLKKQKRVS